MRRIVLWLSSFLPVLALFAAVSSTEAVCWYFFHQPDVPAKLKESEK